MSMPPTLTSATAVGITLPHISACMVCEAQSSSHRHVDARLQARTAGRLGTDAATVVLRVKEISQALTSLLSS